MRQRDKSRDFILLYLVGVIIVVTLACCMCGCSTTKYVPVESVREVSRTDTVHEAVLRTDSVVERDSVRTYVSGDTVMVEKVKWRVRVRERTDTVHKTRTDSVKVMVKVPYPVEVVKEVKETGNKPTWWQRSLMWLGRGAVLAAIVALLIWLTGKIKIFR